MNTAPQKTAETLDFPWKHCLREAGAGGSNPLTPTNLLPDISRAYSDQGRSIDSGQLVQMNRRFWNKVEIGEQDQCWPWTGGTTSFGYGCFKILKKVVLAHRLAHWLSGGQVRPKPFLVMHSCDNPACCNPAHLKLGTFRENALDMHRKRRHRFSPSR